MLIQGGPKTITVDENGVVPSVIFGWDIRFAPSFPWLLRTGLRWLPYASHEVAPGVRFDHGGLEYDYIQLVLYPGRLLQ